MKYEKLTLYSVISVLIMSISLCIYWTAKKEQLSVVVKGKEQNISTFKTTVKDLLKEANITYDEDDIITPSVETELVDYMDIKVTEVEKLTEKEYESIPFETQTLEDKNLEKGKTKVSQEGKEGKKELVYELTYNDGKLVSKELVKESVSKKATSKIVKQGTKEEVIVASKVASSKVLSSNSKHMKVEATAYAGDGITSTGTVPRWGTIAVDPKVIPYGTKVYIPQFDMTFTAEDCGGAIKGNMIDIFMNNNSQAYTWGRRTIDIYIVS